MRNRRIVGGPLALICLAAAVRRFVQLPTDDFDRGMKALAAKDYTAALTLLEAALERRSG